MSASSGTQIGTNTTVNTSSTPAIATAAETPATNNPTIAAPNIQPSPNVSGISFIATTATRISRRIFKHVFIDSQNPHRFEKLQRFLRGTTLGPSDSNSTAFLVPSALPIPVVCAVIEDPTGRVLLAQRPAHKHLGLKWEFAGGKVEPGELPDAALQREIREELGCDIVIARALDRFTHDYGSVVIEMIPFLCALAPASRAPHPHEHVAVQWVPLAAIDAMDLAPADWPVVTQLRSREAERRPTQHR